MRYLLAVILMLSLTACVSSPFSRPHHTYYEIPLRDDIVTLDAVADWTVPIREIEIPSPYQEYRGASIVMSTQELSCLARAIHREARGEPLAGQVAVGYVVLNRVAHTGFAPDTVCGIVHQSRYNARTGRRSCEFSWVCTPLRNAPIREQQFDHALDIARLVMLGKVENPIGNAVFFNTPAANWHGFPASQRTATIGGHQFYST